MSRSGSKHLRIAGVLEIILGIGSIIALRLLLGADESYELFSEAAAESALLGVLYIYVANIFKVLSGILGICLANKKSLLTVICGGLLFIAQLFTFFKSGQDMIQIIINIVLLAIPYYYLHNAVKNYRS